MQKPMAVVIGCVVFCSLLVLIYHEPNPNTEIFCPTDMKTCIDGSLVARIAPTCDFAPCPEFTKCDALNPCQVGTCAKFPNRPFAVCTTQDLCQQCPSSRCSIAESYPVQVFCN